MLHSSVSLLFLACFIVSSVLSSSIRTAVLYGELYCVVDVGTPPVQLFVQLSSVHSGLILWDDPCAPLTPHCPRVCADEGIGPLVCHSECLPEKRHRWTMDCPGREWQTESNNYNRSKSTTHTKTQTTWTAGMLPFWKAEGSVVLDRIAFHDNATAGGDDSANVLSVERAELMVGEIVNYYRLTTNYGGYFGLAPGKHNLVVQAYNQGLIPAPMLAYTPGNRQQTFHFGGLPADASCGNWTRFPAAEKKWSVQVGMEFLNHTFTNETVHFTYGWNGDNEDQVFFSDDIIQRLLNAGAIVRRPHHLNSYWAYCPMGELFARMASEDQEFAFTITSYADEDFTCTFTIGRMNAYGARNNGIVYTNTPTIVLPPTALGENCFSYDYENDIMSFATSTLY